jgi:hypothetical protein
MQEVAPPMFLILLVFVIFVLELGIGVAIIIGALKMMRLQSHGWAMTASILALLPCGPANLLGLVVGIWSLVVLNRPNVKAAFRGQQSIVPSNKVRKSPGSVLAGLLLVAILAPCVLLPVMWWRLRAGPPERTPATVSVGLMMDAEGPSIGDELVQIMQLTPPQRELVNKTLQKFYPMYKKLADENTEHETDARGHQVTRIRPFDDPLGSLEDRFWSAVDPVLDEQQQRVGREHLRLRQGAFQCGGLHIEIWREGAWYHWQGSRTWQEGSRRVSSGPFEGSGPQLPEEYRHFWKEPPGTKR